MTDAEEYVSIIKFNFTDNEVEERTWRAFHGYQEDKSTWLLQEGVSTLLNLEVDPDIIERALERCLKAIREAKTNEAE